MLRNKEGLTEDEFLARYNPVDYPRPSVTADIAVFALDRSYKLSVLLIKRGDHPYMNCWALPGGFCGIDESLEHCACRELKEETNVSSVHLEQIRTFSDPARDPRMRVISTAFIALVAKDKVKPIAGDDAKEAEWFSLDLSEDASFHLAVRHGLSLAFDHAYIIDQACDKLREKLWNSTIAFNLLPRHFSLGEAQKVYETILGRQLRKSNFRVKIEQFVEPTGEYQSCVTHRPSQLYRLKGDHLC